MKADISQLRGAVLKSVSRSFYLSIRLLPARLRDPVALAYLLARATDTIADTAEIDVPLREQQLTALAGWIQGNDSPPDFTTFAQQQTNPAERRLIEQLPRCIAWLASLETADRADVRQVLAPINEGQLLDLRRPVLTTAEELDRYTYLVAGCVGEFWTRVCFRHLPNFATRPEHEMLQLGIEYGKGLQLINILRDAGDDQRAGRSYFPAEQLDFWRRRAEQAIAAGIDYSCAIRPWRVRLATVLPALIGTRTLALIRDAGSGVLHRKVKVPRAEVRGILVRCCTGLVSERTIRALHQQLSRPERPAQAPPKTNK